jgi:hypothetical protein
MRNKIEAILQLKLFPFFRAYFGYKPLYVIDNLMFLSNKGKRVSLEFISFLPFWFFILPCNMTNGIEEWRAVAERCVGLGWEALTNCLQGAATRVAHNNSFFYAVLQGKIDFLCSLSILQLKSLVTRLKIASRVVSNISNNKHTKRVLYSLLSKN